MNGKTLFVALAAAIMMTGAAVGQVAMVWDGGDGEWDSSNWNGGQDPNTLVGRWNGVRNNGDSATISSGDVVYNHESTIPPDFPGDFQVYQGTSLTIESGASLTLFSDEFMAENWWTEFDLSTLTLNNGSLHKVGEVGIEGGGAFILGSWKGDDNYPNPPPPQTIKIDMSNGSTWTNRGQVWFGSAGDNEPGLRASVTINDGTMDFSGGDSATLDNDGVLLLDADLVFHYGWDGDANAPKDEKYAVNFAGPGSLTVHSGGINAAVEDEFGSWTDLIGGGGDGTGDVFYEDLWDVGILRAHGAPSAAGGDLYAKYFTIASSGDAYTLTSTVPNTAVVWDGGDGKWNSDNWNGGQSPTTLLGRNNGVEFGTAGEVGVDVYINSGMVEYDPNVNTGTDSDFRYRRAGTLNIGPGATFRTESNDNEEFVDGYWTEWDGTAINIDGGTFSRGFGGNQESGGAMLLGSWRAYEGQHIEINIDGGGRFENDGQLWFGTPSSSPKGLEVIMTIANGHVDLTGGDNLAISNDDFLITADVAFTYSWNLDEGELMGETYAVNFTGPGTFTVDSGGIIAPVQDSSEDWFVNVLGGDATDLLSYEQLWDVGILQAKGLSGLDGEVFADYFTVAGAVGMDDYTLTWLVEFLADFNIDGKVDGDDFLIWQGGFGSPGDHSMGDANGDGEVDGDDFLIWQTEFSPGSGSGAVPEPASALLALMAALAMAAVTRRR